MRGKVAKLFSECQIKKSFPEKKSRFELFTKSPFSPDTDIVHRRTLAFWKWHKQPNKMSPSSTLWHLYFRIYRPYKNNNYSANFKTKWQIFFSIKFETNYLSYGSRYQAHLMDREVHDTWGSLETKIGKIGDPTLFGLTGRKFRSQYSVDCGITSPDLASYEKYFSRAFLSQIISLAKRW